MPWWLTATTALALAALTAAALAPRPEWRPAPHALMTLIVAQPVSLAAAVAIWPVAGPRAAAALGMGGLACLLVAVWLMPRDDPWRRPPGDDGEGPEPPDDGPGGLDWDEFERLRGEWEADRALTGS